MVKMTFEDARQRLAAASRRRIARSLPMRRTSPAMEMWIGYFLAISNLREAIASLVRRKKMVRAKVAIKEVREKAQIPFNSCCRAKNL